MLEAWDGDNHIIIVGSDAQGPHVACQTLNPQPPNSPGAKGHQGSNNMMVSVPNTLLVSQTIIFGFI